MRWSPAVFFPWEKGRGRRKRVLKADFRGTIDEMREDTPSSTTRVEEFDLEVVGVTPRGRSMKMF
jgi:hypothetical protein